jgi:hypothetical protein
MFYITIHICLGYSKWVVGYKFVSHSSTCWTWKCLPKLLTFKNMLACWIIPKNNDRTSKGRQDVLYIYYGGKWPSSKGFWNIIIKVATKHPFIQTQVNVFNCRCTQLQVYPKNQIIETHICWWEINFSLAD